MKIFVTGGSGYVGGHLIAHLRHAGHDVTALARSARAATAVEAAGASVVAGELGDMTAWMPALTGVDAVVHAAAPLQFWGPKSFFEAGIVEPALALHDAARDSGASRFIFISAAAVAHGGGSGRHRPGEVARRANTNYGWAKAATEMALASRPRADMTRIILRPPLVWGEEMPALADFLTAVRQPSFRWVGGGNAQIDIAHVHNVAAAVTAALGAGVDGRPYFVTDLQPHRFKDLVTDLVAIRGVTDIPGRTVPRPVARSVAWVLDTAARLCRRPSPPPLTRWLVDITGNTHLYDTSNTVTELLYRPAVSYHDGLDRMRRQRSDARRAT